MGTQNDRRNLKAKKNFKNSYVDPKKTDEQILKKSPIFNKNTLGASKYLLTTYRSCKPKPGFFIWIEII